MDWIYSFVQLLMLLFIPLLLVGLAGMFSEKGGVTNIALEGIMILGGFVGVYVTNRMTVAFGVPLSESAIGSRTITDLGQRSLIYLVATLAAVIAGVLISFVHSFAANRLKADQIVTATALNIFLPAICLFLVFALSLSGNQGSYKLHVDTNLFKVPSYPGLGDIPFLGRALFQQTYPSLILGILIWIASIVVLNKTRFGLRLKACGENPYAVSAAGVDVFRYRYAGTAISGGLAAMAGFVYATTYLTEYESNVAGFGFLGLAIMIFGNWKPSLIGIAALLFAFFQTLGSGYTFIPGSNNWGMDTNTLSAVFRMLPFLITLLVLILFSKKNRAPKFDGVPYFAERR